MSYVPVLSMGNNTVHDRVQGHTASGCVCDERGAKISSALLQSHHLCQVSIAREKRHGPFWAGGLHKDLTVYR